MKPRILFITPLPPPVHGSAMVSQYIKDSKLINSEFECDFVNLSTSRTISDIQKRSFRKILRVFGIFGSMVGKLLTHHYDLCYLAPTCHGMGFMKDAPFALLGKKACKRLVLHHHNKGMNEDASKTLYKWLFNRVYNGSNVILLSDRLYADIEPVVGKEQVLVCPNGIKDISIKEHEDTGNVNILFLSNLIESKGVMDLISACKILKDKGLEFTCTFVGNESAEIGRTEFEAATRNLDLTDTVSYLGPRYGDEKEYAFAQADIFAFPTYYFNECFPLTLLEAMQHSLPVVTTDEGGILDIVEDEVTGLIVNKKDPQDLADKLETLINDASLRASMGAAGRKRYEENFTLEKWEQNMINCLRKCLE